MLCQACCRYFVIYPEHGSGHIANGRPGSPGISSNYNKCSKPYPVISFGNQLAQQRNKNDCSGQVIDDCRKYERKRPEYSQQLLFVGSDNGFLNNSKPTMKIYDLHNGHCSNKKKQNLTYRTKVVHEVCFKTPHLFCQVSFSYVKNFPVIIYDRKKPIVKTKSDSGPNNGRH